MPSLHAPDQIRRHDAADVRAAIKTLSAAAPVRCRLASLCSHKAPVCVACPLRMRFIMQRKSVTNNGNVIPRVEPQWVVGMSSQ